MQRYTKMCRGVGYSYSWRREVSFSPRPLYPKEITHSTNWQRVCVYSRCGLDAVEKRKILAPYRNLTSSVQGTVCRYTDRAILAQPSKQELN